MDRNIENYKKIYNNISTPILIMEGQYFIYANSSAISLFDMNFKEDVLFLHSSQISAKVQPDGQESIEKSIEMVDLCLKKGEHTFPWLASTIDGKTFLVEVNLKQLNINNKKYIQCTLTNIDKIKELEENLIKQKQQLEQKNNYINKINNTLSLNNTYEDSLESLLLLEEYKKALDESSIVSKSDLSGNIIYVNDKFCKFSGYTREELIGSSHGIVKSPDTPKSFYVDLWKTIKSKKTYQGVIKNRKKNGEPYYVDSTIMPILDKNNEIVEFIAIRNDVTSLFEKEKVIYEQFTDELTLLANRQKLLKDLKELIHPKLAIINIDRFKDINNSYGIEIGDKILQEFAKRLNNFKIANLNIYRIAGDVFAFLGFGNLKTSDLHKICECFISLCDREDFIIEDNSFSISVSIGIADSQTKLLTHAEVALFWAKQVNVDISIFDKEMPIYKEIKKNIELTKDIKQALKDDNILMFGQKIIDNKSNEVKYETLMRMKLSNGKVVSPFAFLEHAKKARLYPLMTNRIIDKSCEYFKDKDTTFSINLMIEDIKNEKTIEFLFDKLKETNCSNKVVLEIVESEGIEKFEEVGIFIKRAKSLGCKVAIDDFGTGYSNFEYIIKLNVDYLKIDGSLIKNIHVNENIKLTVSTIVNFAKVLGIKTVAEFVHSKEVQDIIDSLEIDFSQGYLFHEPEHLS